jgi:hypothetical protein
MVVVDRDASLEELASLAPGMAAERRAAGGCVPIYLA